MQCPLALVCLAVVGALTATAWLMTQSGDETLLPSPPVAVDARPAPASSAPVVAQDRGIGDQREGPAVARETQVCGRLLGANGEPCRGVALAWRADESAPFAGGGGDVGPVARSGVGGEFVVNAPAGRRGSLVLAARELVFEHPPARFLAEGGTTAIGDFVVVAAALIAGEVVTADGAPVAGASVRIHGRFGSVLTVTSDRNGAFVGDGLVPGAWRITASSLHHLATAHSCDLAAGQQLRSVRIVLASGAMLTGAVVDDRGAPVAAAHVAAALPHPETEGACLPAFGEPVRTDASGRFALPGLRAHGLIVAAWSSGHGPAVVHGLVAADGALLRLERHGALAGRLTGAGGTPQSGSTVVVQAVAGTADAFTAAAASAAAVEVARRATTDADGCFEVRGLPAGRWQVASHGERHLPVPPVVVEIRAGETTNADLCATAGATLTVRVEDPGRRPLAGALVSIREAEGDVLRDARASDGRGEVAFANLPAGAFRIDVEHARFAAAAAIAVDVPGTNPVVVALARGGSATIAVQRGDAPAAATALVVMSDATPPRVCWRGCTDAEGRARTTVLAPGAYFAVHGPLGSGLAPIRTAVGRGDGVGFHVLAGGSAELRLDLPPLATLRGVVADGRGPVGGAEVRLAMRAANDSRFFVAARARVARTDASGAFAIHDLAPGSYRARLLRSGAAFPAEQDVVIAAGQREARVDFCAPSCNLTVAVHDDVTGEPLPFARVTCRRGSPADAGIARILHTGTDGCARWSDLVPGPYELEIRVAGHDTVSQAVAVDGNACDVRVRLPAAAGGGR